MSGIEPLGERIDDVVAALLELRSRLRAEGATPLGGRVVLLGGGDGTEAVAGALMRTGVQELTLVGRRDALTALCERLSREHPSRRVVVAQDGDLDAAWRSEHGVVDARPAAERGELPLDRSWLPAGAWSVRCTVTADGAVVEEVG